MVQATSCRRIIYNNFTFQLAQAVQSNLDEQGIHVDLKDLQNLPEVPSELSSSKPPGERRPVVPYPPLSTPDDPSRIVLYLHSSGVTGLPKTLPFTLVHIMEWFEGRT